MKAAILALFAMSAAAMQPMTRKHALAAIGATSGSLLMTPGAKAEEGFTKTASGLQFKDLKVGEGGEITAGQTVKVHYTGWLNDFGDLDGKFDSSYDRGRPLTFAARDRRPLETSPLGVRVRAWRRWARAA